MIASWNCRFYMSDQLCFCFLPQISVSSIVLEDGVVVKLRDSKTGRSVETAYSRYIIEQGTTAFLPKLWSKKRHWLYWQT